MRMVGSTEAVAQNLLTLRFLDVGLEEQYQVAAGDESRSGFRMIAIASAVLWTPIAFILPVATDLPPELAIPVGLAMSAISLVVVWLSGWANTLDRQHALASLLTSANGSVILVLALVGGALPGYGVAAIMLLLAWGFVSRTRFVYAALRTVVLGVAFVIAVALYAGPATLALDVLLFGAAAAGSLIALRIIERNRRQLFFQERVIRDQSERLAEEAAKSEQLILNILPASIAKRLREGERTIADDYPSVSVLFGDIVGFTPLAAQLSAREVIELLSRLFAGFDKLVAEHGLEKIKTIGDNYMVVGGLTDAHQDHALSVVRLGLAMLEEAEGHDALGRMQLRVGVHSGPVIGGVIGTHKVAFDLWGDTVNVASRLQELGPPGRIHLSEATMKLVRDHFECEPLGESQLRGHSRMKTYAVIGPTRVALAE